MPYPVTHAVAGTLIFAATQQRFSFAKNGKTILLCSVISVIPDADFLLEWGFDLRGLHRGFTHSIVFGLVTGLLFATLFAQSYRARLGLILVAISHGVLDALVTTSKRTGVELAWPFSDYRFTLGVFDSASFSFDPRFDPWLEILLYLLQVSLIETLIVVPFLTLALIAHRSRSKYRTE